jgi:hypothetical protein
MEMDRIEIPPRSTLIGISHTPGTREHLTCEAGEITLRAAGEAWRLMPGDVPAIGRFRRRLSLPCFLNPRGYQFVIEPSGRR